MSAPDLSAIPTITLVKRLNALADYQMSMLRIAEDSDAADRAFTNVMMAISRINAELGRRKQS